MEIDIDVDVEHCSSDIINENISNREAVIEMTKENNEEDNYIDVENISDVDEDEQWKFKEDSDENDELWKFEEDSDENDIDCSQYYNFTTETLEKERKILTARRKLKQINVDIINKKKKLEEEELNLPIAKKTKYFSDKKMQDSQLDTISFDDKDSINTTMLETTNKSEISDKLFLNSDTQSYKETNDTSLSSSDSCNSTNMPGPSDFNCLPSINNIHKNDSNSIININNEYQQLFDFADKIFVDEYEIPVTEYENNAKINQHVEAVPIQECDLIKSLSKNIMLKNNCDEIRMDNSEYFVEDPDIVNPDIIYNISLNEHYKQMDILVQKLSKTSDDLTVLHECMQLAPIPQIQHEKIMFTDEERLNFLNGVSEWEYEIDSEDWNKIMVKRSVVFTAHAGFSIANEESLYVLADVAIDYIKKLAVVMKKNFDIQSKSSLPDNIDPIDNSLQEVGVKNGIRELIKHYEDDVFVRRNKLMKKCQHLQKIIDQYIERMFLDTTIKNQYCVKDDSKEKNSTNDKYTQNEDSAQLKESESIPEETNTEIQINIDEETIDVQSIIEEHVISDTNNKQEDLICIENSNIDQQNDYTKTIAKNINEKKMNNKYIKEKKLLDYDLIKPMEPHPFDCEPESVICKFNETKNDVENNELDTEEPKLYDVSFIREMMEHFNSPITKKPTNTKGPTKLQKMINEVDEDYKNFRNFNNSNNDYQSMAEMLAQFDEIAVGDEIEYDEDNKQIFSSDTN